MCKQFLKRQIVTDVAGLIIYKNKQVLYTVSTEVKIACPMKFAAYPLDQQLCKFLVENFFTSHFYDLCFSLARLEVISTMTLRLRSLEVLVTTFPIKELSSITSLPRHFTRRILLYSMLTGRLKYLVLLRIT